MEGHDKYHMIGIANPGFSFTDTYIRYTVEMLMYTIKNSNESMSYSEYQNVAIKSKKDKPDSVVRMIYPWLAKLNLVSQEFNKKSKEQFILGSVIVGCPQNFMKSIHELNQSLLMDDDEAYSRAKDSFYKALSDQLASLVRNDSNYRIILKNLLQYRTLDEYEFFAICTFVINATTPEDGYVDLNCWIQNYRLNKIDTKQYELTGPNGKPSNAYTYMMNFLTNMQVCTKVLNRYQICNKEKIEDVLKIKYDSD